MFQTKLYSELTFHVKHEHHTVDEIMWKKYGTASRLHI